jgi:hypothetical protein
MSQSDNVSRSNILSSLIERRAPLDQLEESLNRFDFDSEPLITLKATHVRSILEDYLAGKVTAEYVERWADLIEVRDDIEYDAGHQVDIKRYIHDLANPVLSGPLDRDGASQILLDIADLD